jgi:hypothetical protein
MPGLHWETGRSLTPDMRRRLLLATVASAATGAGIYLPAGHARSVAGSAGTTDAGARRMAARGFYRISTCGIGRHRRVCSGVSSAGVRRL